MQALPTVEIVFHYFPDLSSQQRAQFEALADTYFEWNEQINVISRKDIQALYLKHVLHALGIAKVHPFKAPANVLDVGTGGGFPGIPLAILFPQVQFHLVDSIAKKIKVVKEVSHTLKLTNVTAEHTRAEAVQDQYDYIISRAVTRLNKFVPWVAPILKKNGRMIFLKGGDLGEEIAEMKVPLKEHMLLDHFKDEFFETKKVLVLKYRDLRLKQLFSE